jgi:adapter protein MecA 1/2
MWREIPKVNELFSEMMDQAHSELGFEASGPLAVEVFALPAQGMVVIVTRGKLNVHADDSVHEDDESDEDVYEMEVTLEQSDMVMYAFRDFDGGRQIVRLQRQVHYGNRSDQHRFFQT